VGVWGTLHFRYVWARVRLGANGGVLDESGWSESCALLHEDPRSTGKLGAGFDARVHALEEALTALRLESKVMRILLDRTPPAIELLSAERIGDRDAMIHCRLVDARTVLGELSVKYGLGFSDATVRAAQLAINVAQMVRYDLCAQMPQRGSANEKLWRFRRAVQDIAEGGDFPTWFASLGGADGADLVRGEFVAMGGDSNRLFQLLVGKQVKLSTRTLEAVLSKCASDSASAQGCLFTLVQRVRLRQLANALAHEDANAEARADAAERSERLCLAARKAGFVACARAAVVDGRMHGRLAKVIAAGGVGEWGVGVAEDCVAVYIAGVQHQLPASALSFQPSAIREAEAVEAVEAAAEYEREEKRAVLNRKKRMKKTPGRNKPQPEAQPAAAAKPKQPAQSTAPCAPRPPPQQQQLPSAAQQQRPAQRPPGPQQAPQPSATSQIGLQRIGFM
jgi:hypothetical protein